MRWTFILSLLGLVAIGGHATNLGGPQSNLTYFGAPRYSLDYITPVANDPTAIGAVQAPSCSGNSVSRRVAYYQSWNTRTRQCDKVWPSQLDISGLTHLVMAFATIDPTTFEVRTMNPADEDIYDQFMGLSGSVSKWIGLGSWEFSDPGATRTTWSDMTSSENNRKTFIDSLQQFVNKWGFKGVDIDWEWPGASERGGNSADAANQISLLTEIRQRMGDGFGISVVIPAQLAYLQNMDVKGLEGQADWLNVLTYDLHGPWEPSSEGIKTHTDLHEIEGLLEPMCSKNVDPKKVNLGIANYGRGYTVSDKSCMYWGCPFSGPSRTSWCTGQPGIANTCEIKRLIGDMHLTYKTIDGGAQTNEMNWDDQWLGFDDENTLGLKTQFANAHCLGGTSLWALDYSTCGTSGVAPGPQPGPSSSAAPTPSQPVSAPASSAPASSIASDGPSDATSAVSATGSQGSSAAQSSDASSAQGTSANPSGTPAPSGPTPTSGQESSQAGSSGQSTATDQPTSSGVPQSSGSSPGASPGITTNTTPDASSGATFSASSGASTGASSATASGDSSVAQGSSTAPWNTASSAAASSPTDSTGTATSSSHGSTVPGLSQSSDVGTASGSSATASSSSQVVILPFPNPSSGTTTSPGSSGSGSATMTQSSNNAQSSSATGSSNAFSLSAPSGSSSEGQVTSPLGSSISSSSMGATAPLLTLSGSSAPSSTSGSAGGSSAQNSAPATDSNGHTTATPTLPPPWSNSQAPATTSSLPPPPPGFWCPDECKSNPWCEAICSRGHFDDTPPDECWDFRWCLLWWGFPVPQNHDKDPKCQLLGCGCGWMGLPFGPGCPAAKWPESWIISFFGIIPAVQMVRL